MECELCGSRGAVYEVIFQGKRVYACKSCINRYKLHIVKSIGKPGVYRRSRMAGKAKYSVEAEEDLIENYGNLIKKARESLGLTQEDLARELKVKLSYIKKIESQKIIPTPDIVRKIEKILNIKLTEKVEEYSNIEYKTTDYTVTLGDLIGFEDEYE